MGAERIPRLMTPSAKIRILKLRAAIKQVAQENSKSYVDLENLFNHVKREIVYLYRNERYQGSLAKHAQEFVAKVKKLLKQKGAEAFLGVEKFQEFEALIQRIEKSSPYRMVNAINQSDIELFLKILSTNDELHKKAHYIPSHVVEPPVRRLAELMVENFEAYDCTLNDGV